MFAYSYKVVNITLSIYLEKFIFKINTDVVFYPSEVQFPTDVDTHGKIEKAGPTSAVQHVPDRHHVAGETGARPSFHNTVRTEKKLPKLYFTKCLLFSKIVYKKFQRTKVFFYYKSPNFSSIDFTGKKLKLRQFFFQTYIALQHAPTCRDVEKYHVVFQKRHWLRDFMAPIQAVGISQTYSRHTIVVRDKSAIYTRNPNFFWPNYWHEFLDFL